MSESDGDVTRCMGFRTNLCGCVRWRPVPLKNGRNVLIWCGLIKSMAVSRLKPWGCTNLYSARKSAINAVHKQATIQTEKEAFLWFIRYKNRLIGRKGQKIRSDRKMTLWWVLRRSNIQMSDIIVLESYQIFIHHNSSRSLRVTSYGRLDEIVLVRWQLCTIVGTQIECLRKKFLERSSLCTNVL